MRARFRLAFCDTEKTVTDIHIQNLTLERGGKSLFSNFSFDFEAETITALIAPSGAGKTSLLDLIAGLLPDNNKSVSFCARGKAGSGCHLISYVFQEDRLLKSSTVFQNVLLPLVSLFSADEAEKRARTYLEKCGLQDKLNVFPTELSGGEKQRVSLARAFAYPSHVLLMDEAFQSLDLHIKFRLMALFVKLCREEKRTVLLVTHDIREALCLARRIAVLRGSPLSAVLDEKNEGVFFNRDENESAEDGAEAIKNAYISLCPKKAALEEKILSLLAE